MDNAALAQEALRSILPYTYIVGQDRLKLALELAYVAPRIGGVLLSGKRGTAKSTIVRAFASMMYEALPVTIPINATEDRVVGGWQIKELMEGKAEPQPGLLEEAHARRLRVASARAGGDGRQPSLQRGDAGDHGRPAGV